MTVDASWSCLGLATSIGSAIRQIVDARVLLTATVPPALPARSVSDGSLAPPAVAAIMRFLRSACRRHHLASNGPDKARQFAGDRGGDDIGRLAGAGEPAIARAQPGLRLPGDLADRLRLGWFSWRSCSSRLTLAGKRLSSVQRFSLIVGFENSLVGNPANRSAGARPG